MRLALKTLCKIHMTVSVSSIEIRRYAVLSKLNAVSLSIQPEPTCVSCKRDKFSYTAFDACHRHKEA